MLLDYRGRGRFRGDTMLLCTCSDSQSLHVRSVCFEWLNYLTFHAQWQCNVLNPVLHWLLRVHDSFLYTVTCPCSPKTLRRDKGKFVHHHHHHHHYHHQIRCDRRRNRRSNDVRDGYSNRCAEWLLQYHLLRNVYDSLHCYNACILAHNGCSDGRGDWLQRQSHRVFNGLIYLPVGYLQESHNNCSPLQVL